MAQYLNDGNSSFEGGQNEGLLPDRIGQNQFHRGINITTDGSTIRPRPGFVHKPITVVTEGGVGERTYQAIFRSGKFQGAAAYEGDNGTNILAFISGVTFRIDPRTLKAEVVNVGDEKDLDSDDEPDRMNQYRRRIPWTHAGRFFLCFDYPNLPVIIENQDARRSDPDRESFPGVALPEVPTSVLGAFINNRLFVTNVVNEFTAGDPVGGINADAPITFEEVFAPAAAYFDQIFTLGSQSKNQPITALGTLLVPNTATGVGPLLAATRNSVYAFRADLPRAQWETSAFGRQILYSAGIAGFRALANQNSDLIFLSGDNQVRSLLLQSSNQERWENAPISDEIQTLIEEFADPDLTDLAVVASHKNRIYVTIAPYRTIATSLENRPIFDYAHGALAVLELHNVAGLGRGGAPAWAGIWTGISPMEIVVLEEGPYVFSKDDGGANRLYFIDDTITWDEFEGEDKDIISRLYTRSYDFQSGFQDKQLGSIDYSFSDVSGDFTFLAEYKPSHAVNWSKWGCFKHRAVTEICDGELECQRLDDGVDTLSTQAFREMNLGDPDEISCDPLTGEESSIARKLGLRLTIQGRSWTLESIRLRSEILPDNLEPTTQKCDFETKKVIQKDEPNDWEFYRTATRDAEWPIPTSIL